MMNKKIIHVALATVFAGGAAAANAALIAPGAATFTPVQIGSELPTTGILLTDNGNQLQFGSTTSSFAPSAGQNLLVTVNLTGGATFGTANPTLTCSASDSAAAIHGTRNLNGLDSANVVFTVGPSELSAAMGSAGSAITHCYVTAAAISVTGAHTSVNASITYTYGTLSSSTVNGDIIQFQTGLTATVAAAGGDVVALVTGGFMNVSAVSAANIIQPGVVKWNGDGSAMGTGTNISTPLTLGEVLGATSGTVTVAGNALAATKATAGVWLVSASGNCATTGAAGAIATANGGANSITFTGLTPAQMSVGLSVCVQFTGTTAIPEGSITAKVGGTPLAGYSLPTTSALTLMTVTRNGSSTRAMNIPAANNSDQAYIRITNTSGLAGKVYGTLYGQDGVVLGTANSVIADATAFASNAVVVLSAADLKTKLGITSDWTGRAQLVITAETPSMRAQNMVRTANGTLVNVGGDTSTANN